jgi:hypothetical protein
MHAYKGGDFLQVISRHDILSMDRTKLELVICSCKVGFGLVYCARLTLRSRSDDRQTKSVESMHFRLIASDTVPSLAGQAILKCFSYFLLLMSVSALLLTYYMILPSVLTFFTQWEHHINGSTFQLELNTHIKEYLS